MIKSFACRIADAYVMIYDNPPYDSLTVLDSVTIRWLQELARAA